MDEQPKIVRLFLTEAQRLALIEALVQADWGKHPILQEAHDRLTDYGQPQPSDEVKQAVFEDLCDLYGDYSTREVVREVLDDWAPTDYQAHLSYMKETEE